MHVCMYACICMCVCMYGWMYECILLRTSIAGETEIYYGLRSATSDVLEHKWRASLKTILFLYERF